MDPRLEANRLNWDERAGLHATDRTGSYRIADVLAGRSSLHAIEAAEIGDVRGLDLVHLQCHIGLDTISLAHFGARATGLDFSPKAIEAARDFARRAGRPDVRFVEGDVYAAPDRPGETYDRVFTGWGALNWLPDIERWAAVVARLLRPGGYLYLIESHPITCGALADRDGVPTPTYPWRDPPEKPVASDMTHTYTGDARPLVNTRNYEWTHPISEVVTALLGAGLRLEMLREHDRVAWKAYPTLVEDGVDLWRFPAGGPSLPLAYSLRARRPG
ncbi:class I SAM-dependent methyltransferase [Prosthecomicrobium sp. N25]|uniref:class I SAM-dependent methyltransferase n=1 Tax=Prosthecomicrobium sp. N25 TaxID=3129254 RepID=UPI003077293C